VPATGSVSSIYDRMCRLAVGYQDDGDERAIVERRAGASPIVERAVELVRRTRSHPDVRMGSSVRGAIDLVAMANTLADVRSTSADSPDVTLDAALVALTGRVRVREGCSRSPEEIVTELWRAVFEPTPETDSSDGAGKAGAPTGATTT
jgi:MoxR-like ATPase